MVRRVAGVAVLLAACAGSPSDVQPEPPEPPPVVVEEPSPEPVEPVEPAPPPRPSRAERIAIAARELFARELRGGEAAEMLRELTRIAPGRAAGTEAHDRAVRWAEARLAAVGARDVHREPVVVSLWERGEPESAHVVAGGKRRDLRILALGGSVGTPPQGTRAKVARFESIDALLADPKAAQRRIVFFDRPMRQAVVDPREAWAEVAPLFDEGVIEAARAGAVAVLLPSPTLARDDVPRAAWADYGNPSWIPAATLAPADAAALTAMLDDGEPVTASLSINAHRSMAPVLASNVIGEVQGVERPEEIVLLTARLDGLDFGEQAHVHGAAVVHCIEALRLLVARGVPLKRTVRVVLFVDGEEPGRGMRSYVRDHQQELEFHRGIVHSRRGAFAPRGFACTAPEARSAALESLVRALAAVDAGAFERAAPPRRLAAFGDVPILDLDSDPQHLFDVQHSELDTFESVDLRYLRLGAAAVASLAAALADPEILTSSAR